MGLCKVKGCPFVVYQRSDLCSNHRAELEAEEAREKISRAGQVRLSPIPPPVNRIPIKDEFGRRTNRADLSIRYMAQTKPTSPHGLWDQEEEMELENEAVSESMSEEQELEAGLERWREGRERVRYQGAQRTRILARIRAKMEKKAALGLTGPKAAD